MALINNLYVHVIEENISQSIESTTHPVEKGLDITDTIRAAPVELSLSGKIVKAGNVPAVYIIAVIKSLAKKGSLITYSGRNHMTDMQIQSFNHSYPNTVSGGCDFEMTLKQVRIAQPSYKVPKSSSSSKATVKTATTPKTTSIKVGDIVIFTGGNVYVSSTAASPAANRGKSTCKVTIINSNKHPYHLISTDGGKVYGWVDKANVQTKSNTTTQPAASKSTKQVTNGDKNAVYHTVKKGNTVWGLVNNNYKSLGKSVQWVIDNNPKCFSKKGDPTTLIVGSKLLMGYKT